MEDRRDNIFHRVMKRVEIASAGYKTPCWLWTGPLSGTPDGSREKRGGGYPRMTLNSYTVAVHRVMYTHEYGYIPAKKQIDHKCRNRNCVNPRHLEMVSHKENCKRRDKAKAEFQCEEAA